MPTIPKLYDDNETSQTEVNLHRWHFCYLHGEAEFEYASTPDLFLANMPMPTEAGSYPVTVRGMPAVAVITQRHGGLAGRIALVTDTEALTHALDTEAWA